MPLLPPIHEGDYTDEERALIASYILQKRVGTLQALASVKRSPPNTTGGWGEGNVAYYTHAEEYSRFLLYWLGYRVRRNQMYKPGG